MLCRRIDEILAGQLPLSPDIPRRRRHAQRIAAAPPIGEHIGNISHRRAGVATSTISMSPLWRRSASARSGWGMPDCGPWKSPHCPNGWASVRHCVPSPPARPSRAWHATAAAGFDGDPSGRVLPAHQPDRLGQGYPVAHPYDPDRHRGDPPLPESEPGPRPIYHHKPIRAEDRLFITVIAHQSV